MNEFKLNYYFCIYKDKPLGSREEFRNNFKKKIGKFQYIEELIRKIEKYQLKKYGMTLPRNDVIGKTKEEIDRLKTNARNRRRSRFKR